MTKTALIEKLSGEIFTALTHRSTIPLISTRYPEITIEDAYMISKQVLDKRLAVGEKLIGKKIGLTAKAVQDMLGINEPDYGFLTDAMQIENGTTISIKDTMTTPLIEAEIALVMKADLPTHGVTPQKFLDATDYVCACFELVDTRFDTQKIGIIDTIADNASSALFVLGDKRIDPHSAHLPDIACDMSRNGKKILSGTGAAVMGSPMISATWLANKLGSFGVSIKAGDIVLPGSLVPLTPATLGDDFEAKFSKLGSVSCSFK